MTQRELENYSNRLRLYCWNQAQKKLDCAIRKLNGIVVGTPVLELARYKVLYSVMEIVLVRARNHVLDAAAEELR